MFAPRPASKRRVSSESTGSAEPEQLSSPHMTAIGVAVGIVVAVVVGVAVTDVAVGD